jgi:hypothetical protein
MLNELVLPLLGVDTVMKLEGIIYFPTNVNNTADTSTCEVKASLVSINVQSEFVWLTCL